MVETRIKSISFSGEVAQTKWAAIEEEDGRSKFSATPADRVLVVLVLGTCEAGAVLTYEEKMTALRRIGYIKIGAI